MLKGLKKYWTKRLIYYLKDEQKLRINLSAFVHISDVLWEIEDVYKTQLYKRKGKVKQNIQSNVMWVCNAGMGHGKTTALICYLKSLINYDGELIPILLAVREISMGKEIYDEIKTYKPHCIVMVDSTNKSEIEEYIKLYQIVIITHSRLENLAIGFGNIRNYNVWEEHEYSGRVSINDIGLLGRYKKRLLIIDEKPELVNSSIFGIDKENNALKWIDELGKYKRADPRLMQKIKSKIITLLSNELEQNEGIITNSLLKVEELTTKETIEYKEMLDMLGEEDSSPGKIDALKSKKNFLKLLFNEGVGIIDDSTEIGNVGRKIIVSEPIDYSKLGMNILILDGTAEVTWTQYGLLGYELKKVRNYNDYSRLSICQDIINTSTYSRKKKNKTTQKIIANRIKRLREKYTDLIVLATKSDMDIYWRLGVLGENYRKYFELKNVDNELPMNLFNTTGKNDLKDVTTLYLTSLPRRNPNYYKAIAIALYGPDINLEMGIKSESTWFTDPKVEQIYISEMYAELLQIIHRTALRNILLREKINIYIAFSDFSDSMKYLVDLRKIYLHNMKIDTKLLIDGSLYKRNDTINDFASKISDEINRELNRDKDLSIPISNIGGKNGVGETFRKWLTKNNNWNDKNELINEVFAEYHLEIYEDCEDKRKTKKIRFIES